MVPGGWDGRVLACQAMTRKQCTTCPWRKGTNPYDIPNGYSVELHRDLRDTIAAPGDMRGSRAMMACHYSDVGSEQPCVGWLAHQLGPGNNVALRLQVILDQSLGDFELLGEQHQCFEDTLPAEPRASLTACPPRSRSS